ncbi:MAG: sigma-70 family RNA polymerase sigma factor [Alphaproteobacteria bacterium]|nr:sigma-70 family RNA polymerase sigma factor [Alphaproteobacteria bacterium]
MQLYTRYAPAVLRKCERMLGDRQEAEDVTQSLFVDLLRRGRDDVDLPYLYRAATNRCLNRMRDRRRRVELLDQHSGVFAAHGPAPDSQVIPRDLVQRLVGELDERSAEIFVYRFLDGMNQDEIAGLLGTSRRTVVKRLAHIRERVGELAREGGTA